MALSDPNLEKSLQKAEKLDITLAMEIANYVRDEIQKVEKEIRQQVRMTSNDNAKTIKRLDQLETAFLNLQQGLEKTRIERAEKEIQEADARLQIAIQHKDGLSTQEKIEVGKTMEERLEARERDRSLQRKTWWRERVLPGVTTALIISVVAPVGLAFFIGILVFVLRALGVDVQFPP